MAASVIQSVGLELGSAVEEGAVSKVDAVGEEASTTDQGSDGGQEIAKSQGSEDDSVDQVTSIGPASMDVVDNDSMEADGLPDTCKADEEPRRPKSAYFCYLETVRASITEELGSGKGSAVVKVAAERWGILSAEEKAPFESKAAELKAAYTKSFVSFLSRGGVRRMKKKMLETPKKLRKIPRDPNQPLKPKTAFFLFLDSERASIGEEMGSKKGSVVVKRAAEKWKDVTDDVKAPFGARAAELKVIYTQNMAAFVGEGGLAMKKRRYEPQARRLSTGAKGSVDARVETPQKRPKIERVNLKVGARVVGISQHAGVLADGEKLTIKRDARKSSSANSMAVFDGSLGCHVGYLNEDFAARLAPFMDKYPACRVRGRVPVADAAAAGASADLSVSCRVPTGTHDLVAEVFMSVPTSLAPELEFFEASLSLPLGAEPVVAEFCDSLLEDGADSTMVVAEETAKSKAMEEVSA